ncbi:MAG TPA: tetratricopeptide repeat protein [Gemmataceae bacterium]|nr:tetratricopeptide repeat protein [Gemmataceae bacterium]
MPITDQPAKATFGLIAWLRQRWWRWATASLLIVVLVGGGWYGWHHWGRSAAEQPGVIHWAEVRQALHEHEYARARQLLSARLEARPQDAQAQFLMARACRGLKDYEAAERHLTRAAQLHWPSEEVGLELTLQRAQNGDMAAVERPLLEYMKEHPADRLLIYEAMAEGYLASRRYTEMWRLALAWQQEQPDDWMPWLFMGHAFYLDGFAQAAIEHYEKAMKLTPDPALVQLWLAGAQMDSGQYAEAVKVYEAYLVNHPDDVDALFGVANCQASLGQEDAERAALARLLQRDPNHVGGLLLQGKLELDRGQSAKALEWLDRALKLAPSSTDILHNRLRALRDLGRTKEADACQALLQKRTQQFLDIKALKKELRRDAGPGSLATRLRIAKIYRSMGRLDDAAEWYHSVLSIDPKNAEGRRGLDACEKETSGKAK